MAAEESATNEAAEAVRSLEGADLLDEAGHRDLLASLARLGAAQVTSAALGAAARAFGEPALLLSGGATLGFAHLGVIAALHEARALPRILCGSSTGAMVAGGFGCRTDSEIDEFFADVTRMERTGLVRAPWRRVLRHGSVLAPEALLATLERNIGVHTFAEAHARTGRVLCIAVSASGAEHSLRVLSHRDAPEVLVHSAAMASSALPGLFPPQPLLVRGVAGLPVPADARRWRDGSLGGDLPGETLRRAFGAGPLVASQTNPWVLPVLALHRRGGTMQRALDRTRTALVRAARLAERATRHPLAGTARAILEQPYGQDIDLSPAFGAKHWLRVTSNPTLESLHELIAAGREAVRPHVERIRRRVELSRALAPFREP